MINIAGWIILIIAITTIKVVPKGTIFIIDKNTHYLKTVKKGIFFFNPITYSITTKISTSPITIKYTDIFETEDGEKYALSFDVKYSANEIDDILFHLSEERRSIDDLLKSSMYYTILGLKSKEMHPSVIRENFKRNLDSQVLYIGLNVHSYNIYSFVRVADTVAAFKPHKNSIASNDPIQYN